MNRKQPNHRSMLAMAGERSLNNSINASRYHLKTEECPTVVVNSVDKAGQDKAGQDKRIKQIMMKLTLPRLRKMQGLVRGFLVRRRVYPAKLKQLQLANSLLDLIISNAIQKQSSDIILHHQSLTKQLERSTIGLGVANDICDRITAKVMREQAEEVVQKAVTEHAKLITRPKITFGFNLRDPLQLLLYDTLNEFVDGHHRDIARQAIKECVEESRQLGVIDTWITKFGMLDQLYEDIVEECLNENIGEQVVDSILENIVNEGSQVVAKVCLQESVVQKQTIAYTKISTTIMEWMIQQASLAAILQLNHSITK